MSKNVPIESNTEESIENKRRMFCAMTSNLKSISTADKIKQNYTKNLNLKIDLGEISKSTKENLVK